MYRIKAFIKKNTYCLKRTYESLLADIEDWKCALVTFKFDQYIYIYIHTGRTVGLIFTLLISYIHTNSMILFKIKKIIT